MTASVQSSGKSVRTQLQIPTDGLAKTLDLEGDPGFNGPTFKVVAVPENVSAGPFTTSVGDKWKFSDFGQAKVRGEHLNKRFMLKVIGFSEAGKKRKR